MIELTDIQIAQAQAKIDNLRPGVYSLQQIYGQAWNLINSPTTFGKRFKGAVQRELFRNIQFNTTESNNHAIYEIIPVQGRPRDA